MADMKKLYALYISFILPSAGAAVASGELGLGAFSWIPDSLLNGWLNFFVSWGNALVNATVTFATRFVGSVDLIKRYYDYYDPDRQLQNQLVRALSLLSIKEQSNLQTAISDLRKEYKENDEFVFQVLNHPTVKEKLKTYYDQPKQCSDSTSTVFWTGTAGVGSLFGGVTFAQKFSDGIDKLANGNFASLPYIAKLIPALIAGLPTNALYLVNSLSNIPIMWDSMSKRSRKKAISTIIFGLAVCSCSSMLDVATKVSNIKNGLFSDIIPPTEDKQWLDFVYPLLTALIGPLSVNGMSIFNLLCRNPNMENPTLDDILFWTQQNELSNSYINELRTRYEQADEMELENGVSFGSGPAYVPAPDDDTSLLPSAPSAPPSPSSSSNSPSSSRFSLFKQTSSSTQGKERLLPDTSAQEFDHDADEPEQPRSWWCCARRSR